MLCPGYYTNSESIGPKTSSGDCAISIRSQHERGEQVLEIAMTKMRVSKDMCDQSTHIMEEYGRNELPAGTSPRMLQLTTPKGKRTDFNAKDGKTWKKACDELQRALAAVVGEEGIAGAPTGIGA